MVQVCFAQLRQIRIGHSFPLQTQKRSSMLLALSDLTIAMNFILVSACETSKTAVDTKCSCQTSTHTKRSNHITNPCCHSVVVSFRIDFFKSLRLVFTAMNGLAPACICDLQIPYELDCCLRSSGSCGTLCLGVLGRQTLQPPLSFFLRLTFISWLFLI